jgi:putative oxidoreductase
MDLALLVLRVVVGLLFVAHGSQKLFGSFGGGGLRGTTDTFDTIGLRPARLHALAAGLSELIGGALLALGLVAPIGAALIIAVMTAAIMTVHWSNGLWNTNGGFEFNLLVIAVAFAIAGVGSGNWSLDHVLGIDWMSTGWALAALVAGVLGGLVTVLTGRMAAAREDRGARPHPA